jgi:hypothetical protein
MQDLISTLTQSGGGLHVAPGGQATAQPLPPVTAQLKPLPQSESCRQVLASALAGCTDSSAEPKQPRASNDESKD